MWLTHLHLQRCTQTNSICVRMSGRHVENPSPSSEEVSSPSQRPYDVLSPLSVKQLLQQRVVNKLLGLDAQKSNCCIPCSAVCSAPNQKKGAAGNYKSGAITQQQIWQEQCCTLFELQDSFTHCLFQWAWTMQAECALCCRAGDCSSELGVNYKRGLCKLDVMASQYVWSVSFSRNLSPGYTQGLTLWTSNYSCQNAAITAL